MVSENKENNEIVLIPIEEVQTVRWTKERGAQMTKLKEKAGLSFKKIEEATAQLGCRSSDAFIIKLFAGEYAGVSVNQLEAICKAIGTEVHHVIPQIKQKNFLHTLDIH